MIKVFTSAESAATAGRNLNNQFEDWLEKQTRGVEVLNIDSNSNKYGWMLVINYKFI